ncbi:MAG: hypothetical protein U7126_30455 [Microcoleus sp.]
MKPELIAKQQPKTFSDTESHWAASMITQKSSDCSIASSLNETGSRFAPDDSAKRNYAGEATLRILKCVKAQ